MIGNIELNELCMSLWNVQKFPFQWEYNPHSRRLYHFNLKAKTQVKEEDTPTEIAGRLIDSDSKIILDAMPEQATKVIVTPSIYNISRLRTSFGNHDDNYLNLPTIKKLNRLYKNPIRTWNYYLSDFDGDTLALKGSKELSMLEFRFAFNKGTIRAINHFHRSPITNKKELFSVTNYNGINFVQEAGSGIVRQE